MYFTSLCVLRNSIKIKRQMTSLCHNIFPITKYSFAILSYCNQIEAKWLHKIFKGVDFILFFFRNIFFLYQICIVHQIGTIERD